MYGVESELDSAVLKDPTIDAFSRHIVKQRNRVLYVCVWRYLWMCTYDVESELESGVLGSNSRHIFPPYRQTADRELYVCVS